MFYAKMKNRQNLYQFENQQNTDYWVLQDIKKRNKFIINQTI